MSDLTERVRVELAQWHGTSMSCGDCSSTSLVLLLREAMDEIDDTKMLLDLLRIYVDWVAHCEGVTFITQGGTLNPNRHKMCNGLAEQLTDEQQKILMAAHND
jgi:hypothetical protein